MPHVVPAVSTSSPETAGSTIPAGSRQTAATTEANARLSSSAEVRRLTSSLSLRERWKRSTLMPGGGDRVGIAGKASSI